MYAKRILELEAAVFSRFVHSGGARKNPCHVIAASIPGNFPLKVRGGFELNQTLRFPLNFALRAIGGRPITSSALRMYPAQLPLAPAAGAAPKMDGSFVLVPEEAAAAAAAASAQQCAQQAGWWNKLAGWWWQAEDGRPGGKEDDLWRDWEYIAAPAETFAAEQSKREAESATKMHAANKQQQMRPLFVQAAQAAFATLSEADATHLRTSPLASDKRAAMIAETVRRVEQRWLLRFLARFYAGAVPELRAQFQGSFFEMPYAKNVVGAVVRPAPPRTCHLPNLSAEGNGVARLARTERHCRPH